MTRYPPPANWRSPDAYSELLICDRRAFAWEWLRRSPDYRDLWNDPGRTARAVPGHIGLLAWVDPALAAPDARPIWSIDTDPHVLRGRPADTSGAADDLVDIRSLSSIVSVEVDAAHVEHWLLSDGHWAVRLDLHDGTLLGGPTLVEHRVTGLASAEPKIEALRQFVLLARKGRLSASLLPRERRAAQWILELRAGDALLDGAPQQAIARALFRHAIAPERWRIESASYRLRVQRLLRVARRYLAAPLSGPWFD